MSEVPRTLRYVSMALYRRYRPQTFQDVIGQEHVTRPLMAALRADRTAHAYLFSGPRGCGKTTSARILARCLNCIEAPTDTPCGKCESCRELALGGSGSLDVVEMDAASHGGVDDARELIERAAFAPSRDRYKVFIIDEAHMVSTQGFNALLKLVEEPPAHIKFIFATTEPEKVIGTIRSRTHHYPFRLVPPEELESYMAGICAEEGINVGGGVLPLVVRAGGGSVRDSLSVLDQLMGGSENSSLDYSQAIALLGYTDGSLLDDAVEAIAASDGATLFSVVERVVQSGHDPRRFVEDLLQRLRDVLVISLAGEQAHDVLASVPQDQLARMITQAEHLGAAKASRAADLTNEALNLMVGATSPRLQLELLCARLLVLEHNPLLAEVQGNSAAQLGNVNSTFGSQEARGARPALPPRPAAAQRQAPPAQGGNPTVPGPRISPTWAAQSESSFSQRNGENFASDAKGNNPDPLTSRRGEETAISQQIPGQSARMQETQAQGLEKQNEPVRSVPTQESDASQTSYHAPQVAQHMAQAAQHVAAQGPRNTAQEPQHATAQAQYNTVQPPHVSAPSNSVQPEPQQPASQAGASSPEQQVNPASRSRRSNEVDVTIIRQRWSEITDSIRQHSKSTAALVDEREAVIAGVREGVLGIQFRTAALATTFNDRGHAPRVVAALRDVLGLELQARGFVGGDSSPKAPAAREVAPESRAPQVSSPAASPVRADRSSSFAQEEARSVPVQGEAQSAPAQDGVQSASTQIAARPNHAQAEARPSYTQVEERPNHAEAEAQSRHVEATEVSSPPTFAEEKAVKKEGFEEKNSLANEQVSHNSDRPGGEFNATTAELSAIELEARGLVLSSDNVELPSGPPPTRDQLAAQLRALEAAQANRREEEEASSSPSRNAEISTESTQVDAENAQISAENAEASVAEVNVAEASSEELDGEEAQKNSVQQKDSPSPSFIPSSLPLNPEDPAGVLAQLVDRKREDSSSPAQEGAGSIQEGGDFKNLVPLPESLEVAPEDEYAHVPDSNYSEVIAPLPNSSEPFYTQKMPMPPRPGSFEAEASINKSPESPSVESAPDSSSFADEAAIPPGAYPQLSSPPVNPADETRENHQGAPSLPASSRFPIPGRLSSLDGKGSAPIPGVNGRAQNSRIQSKTQSIAERIMAEHGSGMVARAKPSEEDIARQLADEDEVSASDPTVSQSDLVGIDVVLDTFKGAIIEEIPRENGGM